MFTRSLVSRSLIGRNTIRYAHHAPAAHVEVPAKEEHLITAFHLGRPLDLSKVAPLFKGTKTQSGPNFLKVFADEGGKRVFDVYSYGSVVFYNTPRETQRTTTAKLLALEVDAASAPYQMEGYDNYDALLEFSVDDAKVVQYNLNHSGLDVWHAVGVVLARNTALQFFDASLDRVIDGIFTLSEDELREHVSYITNNVNSVDVEVEPKLESPSATSIYIALKQELQPDTVFSEFHFKNAVLRSQYNITGAPQLKGTAA